MAEETIKALSIRMINEVGENFCIAQYKNLSDQKYFTAVGTNLPCISGMIVILTGEWKEKTFKGKTTDQFVVKTYEERLPKKRGQVVKYLTSIGLPKIKEKQAEGLFDKFGPDVFNIIETEPERMKEAKGFSLISIKDCHAIQLTWFRRHALKEYMTMLDNLNLNTSLADKVLKSFGGKKDIVEKIKKEPYRLCRVQGIDFLSVDKEMKKKTGFDFYAPDRMKAGIDFCLQLSESGGDCFVKPLDLATLLVKRLGLPLDYAKTIINQAIMNDDIVYDRGVIYSEYTYEAENICVERLNHLLHSQQVPVHKEEAVKKVIDNIEKSLGFTLAEKQREAILMAHAYPVCIITGGPGTGKTTTENALISSFEEMGGEDFKVVCLAPTGKAARRMAESTGRNASTIHSHLRLQGDELLHHLEPIDADVVVVDEFSMCDIFIASILFSAIKPTTRLIIVGDVDQLPSVKCGNVFADLINSGVIPTIKLDVTYRQAEGSSIIANALTINGNGESKLFLDDEFSFVQAKGSYLVSALLNEVQRQMQFFDTKDIMVLDPFKIKDFGTIALNKELQKMFNPPADDKEEIADWYNATWRVGDRVMQLVNDNDREVYNGDTGYIVGVQKQNSSERKKGIKVMFETGVSQWYNTTNMNELTHAFAITIHKSQGSEYPCAIILFPDEAGIFRQKKLLYTAVTRAKKRAVIVGTPQSVRYAVDMKSPLESRARNSNLAIKLVEAEEEYQKSKTISFSEKKKEKKRKSKLEQILGQISLFG